MIFVSKLFLGLVFAAVVWTVRGERSLNSSTSSDKKTERATERTRYRRAQSGPLIMTQEERIDFLATHNKIRNDISGFLNHEQPSPAGMMKMYWSAELEASAVSWSMYCCNEFKHGQGEVVQKAEFLSRMAQYGSEIGQNIYKGKKPTGSYMIKLFADETAFYTFKEGVKGTCEAGKKCGHYTQVVWQDSFLVGCGYAKCGNYYTGTCNYLPAGNWAGSAPYKSGQACSLCASDNTYNFKDCEGQLCVPKDRCSPVKECKVVDTENCLCSDSSYNEIVGRLLGIAGPSHVGPVLGPVPDADNTTATTASVTTATTSIATVIVMWDIKKIIDLLSIILILVATRLLY